MATALIPQYVVIGYESSADDSECEDFTTSNNVTIRDDRPYHIVDGLYMGSCLAEQHKVHLQKAGVTHVLQVADGLRQTHPGDFQYLQIHVQDEPSTDLVAHFSKAFDFIDSAIAANGSVFVHCVAGVSRSAAVCIGYLMWKHRCSYQKAHKVVKDSRPWISPNPGFVAQLQELERLDFDLSSWRAWRHSWKEQPVTVTVMAM